MKRIAAAAAFLLLYGTFSPTAAAATLRSLDQDGLNLRGGPGTTHAIIGGIGPGEAATILGREGDWYRVQLASGTEGWVAAWVSRVLLEDEQRFAVVTTDVLNVRQAPSLTAGILTRVTEGQHLRLMEMIPDWWRIRLDDGTEGWVNAQYVKQATGSTAPPAVTPPANPGTPGTPVDPPPPVAPVDPATPLQPPAAPPGSVPGLVIPSPAPLVPLPGKLVQVRIETGVFAGPNSEARRVDTARSGETLRLLDASGGWVRTETPAGKRGWIQGSLVEVLDGRVVATLSDSFWALATKAPAAPTPTVPAPSPAPTPEAPFRLVADPEGLNLRLIPATTGRVLAVLPQGERLEVLQRDGIWLRVQTAAGQTGWVHADYTRPDGEVAPAPAPEPPPASTPAPAPEVTGPQFTVRMEQPYPGASRLVVETKGKPVGEPIQAGSILLIPFETGETEERPLPLHLLGVQSATLSPAGLKLELVGQPNLKVEQASPEALSLLLRPVLQGIQEEVIDSKAVFRFQLSGETQPKTTGVGGLIQVDLPGAVLAGPITQTNLLVSQMETGVRVLIPSTRAFSMKRSEQGFYLVLYPPGLAGKSIMLDAGHGGDDGGAVSRALGVVEKEVNLQVALRLRALLEAEGATVYMTRATDQRAATESFLSSANGEPRDQLDMQYRTILANEMKVDAFLSIHHNSGEPGVQGTETYYTSKTLNGERSRTLAQLIQEELAPALQTRNRGAKDDTFYVTRNTEAPAALVEVAFVNDPTEGPRTKDPAFQEAAAKAIFRALERLYAERTP